VAASFRPTRLSFPSDRQFSASPNHFLTTRGQSVAPTGLEWGKLPLLCRPNQTHDRAKSLLARAAVLWIFSCKQEPARFDPLGLMRSTFRCLAGAFSGPAGLTHDKPGPTGGQEDTLDHSELPNLSELVPLQATYYRGKIQIAMNDAFDSWYRGTCRSVRGRRSTDARDSIVRARSKGLRLYLGTSCADFVIGNIITEAVYPTMMHYDPRYFRQGTGSKWSRMAGAAGQIFCTHTDSGHTQFNYSEVIGNSTAVAISNVYYSNNRTAIDTASKLGVQLGRYGGELPDINRKFSRKHRDGKDAQ
jgi:hypothetical protein